MSIDDLRGEVRVMSSVEIRISFSLTFTRPSICLINIGQGPTESIELFLTNTLFQKYCV